MSRERDGLLFQRNMEVFSKRYPECVEKFSNREYEIEENVMVEVETAYSGEPILTITKDGKKRYLAGKYAPERPILDWLEAQDRVYHEMVFFVIGMGNWIQLKEFLEKIDKKVTVILYEPSVEIFEKVMKNYDVAGLLEKYDVGLVVEKINPEYLASFFSACIHRENMSVTKVYVSGNYLSLFPELVKDKVEELKKYFEKTMITWNTMIRYTDVVGENVLNNIAYLYHGYSVSQFKGILPEDVPVIVVSAGPSLNKNINDLKKAVGKCCIIATDTAIKPLLNRGIQPQFVAIVDGKKPALLFEHSELSKSALLTATDVAKDVMNLHKGKKVFYEGGSFYDRGAMKSINREREGGPVEILPLLTGGSVANTAFSFALCLGTKNVILIGQDLAMTGNKTHADGTFKEKMEDIDIASKEYFEVESIDGGKILTRADFDHYRKWFEERIEEINKNKTGIRVIDATEGGAKIHGAEIMTLKDAIAECCVSKFDIDEKIAEIPEMLSDKDKENLLRYFANTISKLEEVRKKTKAGISNYDKMIKLAQKKELNTSKYLALYKKVKRINDYIDSDDMARFVLDNLEDVENSMLATINLTKENERDERIVVAQKGKAILEAMLPMIDTLSDMSKETVAVYKGDDSILYAKYNPIEVE